MFIFGFIVGVLSLIIVRIISHKKQVTDKSPEHIEVLKNALLSFALSELRQKDFDGLNFSYNSFDGTKLPGMSGFDTANACMSYILDISEFRKSPFYSITMENKLNAINKYLKNNFDTDEKVLNFVNEYIEKEKSQD